MQLIIVDNPQLDVDAACQLVCDVSTKRADGATRRERREPGDLHASRVSTTCSQEILRRDTRRNAFSPKFCATPLLAILSIAAASSNGLGGTTYPVWPWRTSARTPP